MASSDTIVCTSCGAVVRSDRCGLCGTPVAETAVAERDEDLEPGAMDAEEPSYSTVVATTGRIDQALDRRTCSRCGELNRRQARYCDRCGQRLSSHSVPLGRTSASETPAASIERDAKPRVGRYVGGAILAVIGLYLISVFSAKSPDTAATASSTAEVATSEEADLDQYIAEDAGLAQALIATRNAVESADDPARRQALLEELVQSYAGAGRLDLAGREQEQIARELNTSSAWATAGNLHFDWMENQSGSERVRSARRAVRAYERALEIDPNNLDVRTDLGVAYLNDPASPMLAIQNTNMVLEADSNHVQANFNKGVMLAQIGRTEEAAKHFRKVAALSAPGEPAHERALQVLSQLGMPLQEESSSSG